MKSKLEEAKSASRRALLVTSFGALSMLAGILLLESGAEWRSIAAVLILVGALSKSAIFPFHI
jgi:NADH:ubiquinone oxidoreductase subunit 5 (subunit L)/multisubunit Na+/H+ antiporter MnhA subunit